MADGKRGRERQAKRTEQRQRERAVAEERASFVPVERYREETGQGTVEAKAHLCRAHTNGESPSNLDSAGEDDVPLIERRAHTTGFP